MNRYPNHLNHPPSEPRRQLKTVPCQTCGFRLVGFDLPKACPWCGSPIEEVEEPCVPADSSHERPFCRFPAIGGLDGQVAAGAAGRA